MKRIYTAIFFIALAMILLHAPKAKAAFFYLNKSGAETFEIYLDTEGQEINALEAEFSFPQNIKIRSVDDGNSAIPLWVNKPRFDNEQKTVAFSGIIPGGFSGRGQLLNLELNPMTEILELKVNNAKIFLNGPNGEEAKLNSSKIQIISENKRSKIDADTDPPESFTPELVRSDGLGEGKWMIIFGTVDKGSGMDHYEVLEIIRRGSPVWIRTESPYILKDQNLSSDTYVRAVDRAGNFIVVKVPAAIGSETVARPLRGWILNLLLLVMISAVGAVVLYKKRASK